MPSAAGSSSDARSRSSSSSTSNLFGPSGVERRLQIDRDELQTGGTPSSSTSSWSSAASPLWSSEPPRYYLAVDCGGTKAAAAVASSHPVPGTILAVGHGGPSNYTDIATGHFLRNVRSAIEDACFKAGLITPQDIPSHLRLTSSSHIDIRQYAAAVAAANASLPPFTAPPPALHAASAGLPPQPSANPDSAAAHASMLSDPFLPPVQLPTAAAPPTSLPPTAPLSSALLTARQIASEATADAQEQWRAGDAESSSIDRFALRRSSAIDLASLGTVAGEVTEIPLPDFAAAWFAVAGVDNAGDVAKLKPHLRKMLRLQEDGERDVPAESDPHAAVAGPHDFLSRAQEAAWERHCRIHQAAVTETARTRLVVANDTSLLAAPLHETPVQPSPTESFSTAQQHYSHFNLSSPTDDGEQTAVVVIAGTGSIVTSFRRDDHGGVQTIGRAGGFGWLLGDEGSGFAVGREAIKRVLERADRERLSTDPATAANSASLADQSCGVSDSSHPSSSASDGKVKRKRGHMLRDNILEYWNLTSTDDLLGAVYSRDGPVPPWSQRQLRGQGGAPSQSGGQPPSSRSTSVHSGEPFSDVAEDECIPAVAPVALAAEPPMPITSPFEVDEEAASSSHAHGFVLPPVAEVAAPSLVAASATAPVALVKPPVATEVELPLASEARSKSQQMFSFASLHESNGTASAQLEGASLTPATDLGRARTLKPADVNGISARDAVLRERSAEGVADLPSSPPAPTMELGAELLQVPANQVGTPSLPAPVLSPRDSSSEISVSSSSSVTPSHIRAPSSTTDLRSNVSAAGTDGSVTTAVSGTSGVSGCATDPAFIHKMGERKHRLASLATLVFHLAFVHKDHESLSILRSQARHLPKQILEVVRSSGWRPDGDEDASDDSDDDGSSEGEEEDDALEEGVREKMLVDPARSVLCMGGSLLKNEPYRKMVEKECFKLGQVQFKRSVYVDRPAETGAQALAQLWERDRFHIAARTDEAAREALTASSRTILIA
ncbi:hypothetical protein OC846_003226 [Tilletia horrida]|uniref:GlcNAc kinase n=1 Tax=Tilletia horrida TaxID=155126 RepID=A0AAN6GSW5_9BASI|nr:hypothetical protein OC846_003226 [Tilletia horrida]